MAGRRRYSKRAVREAIQGSKGIKTAIMQRLACSRSTLDRYLDRYPELQTLLSNERESIIDLAESKLYQDVGRGDQRAYMFVLETLGKNRGWSKRTEITGADGGALVLSTETLAAMDKLGFSADQAVREFERMVQQAAMADTGDDS